MKKTRMITLWILGVLVCLVAVFLLSVWISGGNTPEGETKIAQKGWAEIGGVRQGYFIRGEQADNPIILFLHGGPGSPELPLIEGVALEQYFTVCYWDQRGAGMTFSRKTDPSTLTVERMIEDTREMTDSLRRWYSVDKVYLMGHSWGSFLGVKTIEKYPELYHAYIGIGQVANQRESERLAYDYILEQARGIDDQKTIRSFEKFDKDAPDFPTNEYLLGARMQGMNDYGVGMTHKKPSMIRTAGKILYYGGYTFKDKLNYLQGMKFSIDALFPSVLSENLIETTCRFEVPIYIIQGKYDYQVSHKLAKDYFDSITAPKKEFFTFENSAHSPNIEEPEHFAEVVNRIKQ